MSGSSPERSVGQAMDSAEARVNRSTEDIGKGRNPDGSFIDKKADIKLYEASVKKAIEGYKQMGIYEEVKGSFVSTTKDLTNSGKDTPESLLAAMVLRFDSLAAAESAEAGTALNLLAVKTYNNLNTLKKDLGDAAGKKIALEQKAQTEYQKWLPEYHFDPSNISESVKGMGDLMGRQPNAEKLKGYEVQNDSFLSELRLQKNAGRYSAASTEFRYIAGCSLEDVGKTAAAGLQKAYEKAKVSGVNSVTQTAFSNAFVAALDLLKMTNTVVSNALYSEDHAETKEHSEHAEAAHGDLLSEDEMQVMLGVLMNGTEDKTYFGQLFDAKTAIDYYAGHEVDLNTLTPVQRQAFALTNGLGKGAAATFDAFRHPWDSLCHIGAAAKGLLKPSTWAKLYQMSSYTWEHTSALEKNMLIGDITGQLLGGAAIGTGLSMVMKSGTLGKMGTKLASVARVTGVVGAAERIAMAVNPVLTAFPRLAAYGADAAEIATNFTGKSATIAKKWDHLVHNAHTIHGAFDKAEVATANTSGIAHTAHDVAENATLPTTLPIYAEIRTLKEDYKIAEANAGKLGMSANDIYKMQSAIKVLGEA